MFSFQIRDLTLRRKSNNSEYFLQLIHCRLSLKDRISKNKLCKYASNTPHINGLIARREAQQNLGSSVPSGCYILSNNVLIILT